jgi:protoporphyrinogen oxidase
LYRSVAPQDGYKSPSAEVQRPLGYNAEFCYPEKGLDALTVAMAARCDVRYGKRVVGIDRARRVLCFADGTEHGYDVLISTLPLHLAVRLSDAEEEVGEPPDPYTSVLVLNIGAARGPSCPDSHWQYESDSRAGFHRVGFYSNVDTSFLPASTRAARTHVSMYVESAYGAGHAPTRGEVSRYSRLVVEELKQRGYIGRTEVVDPSFVECAYTWRRPGSRWVERSIEILGEMGILQVGRYGRWHFQGIAESVSEGLAIGERLAGRPVAEASVPRAPRRSTSCT